jgi:transposase-like protein
MKSGTFRKLSGQVEADETWIGPNPRMMHRGRREERGKGRERNGWGADVSKAIIAGLLDRKRGRVHAEVVPNVQAASLAPIIRKNVKEGSEMITDMNRSYWQIRDRYIHSVIDKTTAYVKGHVHTNGMENFWSLLKRALRGTYISVEPFHLGAYVDEQVFRYNQRRDERGDSGRFVKVLRSVMGRRLTYATLTT